MPAPDEGWVGNWSPGIGDPSFFGWLTVIAYFAAALGAWAASRRITAAMAALSAARRERWFWRLLSLAFGVLGINKQLDLQSLLTELGRLAARAQGWYEVRRSVQFAFIAGAAAVGLLAALSALYLVRAASAGAKVAALGSALVVTFVVVRAASFHHVDELIDVRWLGLRVNWILELGGIAVVLAGTALQWRDFARVQRAP